jgi:hypothetical protein
MVFGGATEVDPVAVTLGFTSSISVIVTDTAIVVVLIVVSLITDAVNVTS